MEKQTPIPLKSKMKLHKNQNQSVSLDLKWKGGGGGEGGHNFLNTCILLNKMEQETAIPAMDEATQKSKCSIFPPFILWKGDRV